MFTKLIRWVRRMLGLSINLTTPRVGGLGAIPGATGTASFLDGAGATVTAPVLGQPLFIAPGTFSGTPTVYDYQVYADSVAIGDATGTWDSGDPVPAYIPTDDIVGAALVVKCHGRNSSGTSPTTNDSSATSALADIGTGTTISGTPISAFTRTSVSGVTPMTSDVTFGANVFEGYFARENVYSNSGLTILTQSVRVELTNTLMQSAAALGAAFTTEGLVALGATDFATMGVETTSPNGRFFSYTYPDALSPTDPVAANLADNFDDNSLDAALWTVAPWYKTSANSTGVTVAEANQELEVTAPSATAAQRYSGYKSQNPYDLTGKANVVAIGHGATQTGEEFYVSFGANDSNKYIALVTDNVMYLCKVVAGSFSLVGGGVAWNAATMHWVGLRHISGTDVVHMVYSTNATGSLPAFANLTSVFSETRDSGVSVSAAIEGVGGGCYGSVTPTLMKFLRYDTVTA